MDATKAVLRGKFMALSVYIRKEENFLIDHLNSCETKLEKQNQNEPKVSRRKDNNNINKNRNQ